MDWLRRNWPDLMIGAALLVVIAGIVATLLTGGSFFQFGSQSANPSSQASPAVTLDDPNSAVVPDESTPSAESEPSVAEPEEGASDASSQIEPLAPEGSLVAPATPPGAPASDVEEESTEAPTEPEVAQPAAPAPAEQPEEASSDRVSLPDAGAPSDPYRISVGAFGSRTNAEALAQQFREDGYPVFLGVQGNLTIVLVGPYATRAEAERVAAEIRAGDYDTDPVVYLFEPEDPEPSQATPSAPSTPAASPAETPAAPADSTPATPAPASAAARSLQVGAFADEVSAEPLLTQLERLGFAPRSVREDGLIKVLVGPFEGDALEDARTILDGAGLEYFNRQ